MKKIISIFIVISAFLGCNENSTIYTDTGSVKGRIALQEKYVDSFNDLSNVNVQIIGTNESVLTGPTGDYSIGGIPIGNYTITASIWSYSSILVGSIENVSVEGGKVTKVPDIILDKPLSEKGYSFVYLRVRDSLKEHQFNVNPSISNSRQVSVVGEIQYENEISADTVVSINFNGNQYLSYTNKQLFLKTFSLEEGLNEFVVWMGDTHTPTGTLDTALIYYSTSIDRIDISLDWGSSNAKIDAGDLDIHLVNEQTGDSCWFKNENPDWGITDLNIDDPILFKDENPYSRSFGSESLKIVAAANGIYTLKINYFTNRSDSTIQINPTVRIELNGDPVTYKPPNAMNVGETWTVTQIICPIVGKISPEKIVEKTNIYGEE